MRRLDGRVIAAGVLLVSLTSAHVHATTVVLLATRDRVVIAGDSRQKATNESGSLTDDSACKIAHVGSSALGLWGDVADRGGFDARRSLAATTGAHTETLRKRYESLLQELYSQHAAISPTKVFEIGLALGAFDGSTRTGSQFLAGTLHLPAGTSESRECRQPCADIVVGGAQPPDDDVKAVRAELRRGPTEARMIAIARRLVTDLGLRFPAAVGGPVDIVVLDRRGAHWVSRKAHCAE